MCVKHPGFDVDLVVATDPVSMMRVFSGITTLAEAVADDKIRILGPPKLTKAFGSWFLWSPFVPAVRDRSPARSNAPRSRAALLQDVTVSIEHVGGVAVELARSGRWAAPVPSVRKYSTRG